MYMNSGKAEPIISHDNEPMPGKMAGAWRSRPTGVPIDWVNPGYRS